MKGIVINMKYPYGKNVLITGGSSGIGRAAADKLAENGFIVYAGSRRPAPDTRKFPGGGEIRPVSLDVRDAGSIGHAADEILREADIGIIVHCAGIGIAGAGESVPMEAAEDLMDTNFNGVLRVNAAFLPHLRKRGQGLIIVIGSVAGVFAIPFQSHYSASKAALEAYVKALRLELKPFGVRASLIMPGDTSTGFTEARDWKIDDTSPYYIACLKATQRMERDERNGRPPSSVANVIFKLCGQESPPVHKTVGFDYKLLVFLRRLLPERVVEFLLGLMYTRR